VKADRILVAVRVDEQSLIEYVGNTAGGNKIKEKKLHKPWQPNYKTTTILRAEAKVM
jgi:hypothetical protein